MAIKKDKKRVTFIFEPARECKAVALAGSFNEWAPEQGKMRRQKDGSYRKRLELQPGEHRYKFIVDGQWQEDPEAERQVTNAFGTCDSVVTVP